MTTHRRQTFTVALVYALLWACVAWPCKGEAATLLWKVPTGSNFFQDLVVADGRIFTQTKYGTVDILDLENGTLIQELAKPETTTYSAVGILAKGDVMYVMGTNSDVVAFSLPSGDVIWSNLTCDIVYHKCRGARMGIEHFLTRPQANAEHLYTASSDGFAYALSLSDGERIWAQRVGQGVTAPPLLHSGELYVVSSGGELLALEAMTGSVLWRVDLGEHVESCQPALQGESLFVCGGGGSVFSISIAEQEISWVSQVGRKFRGCIDVKDGLLVAADEAGIYCLDTSDGDLMWHVDGHSDNPVIWDGVVYSLTRAGRFLLMDVETGNVLEQHDILPGRLWSRPVVAEGKVIVTGKDRSSKEGPSFLYCFDLQESADE